MINVALVGCGRVALKSHITAWSKLKEARVVAVCDIDNQRAEHIAKLYGVARVFTSYDELLKEKDIDLIDLATPSDLHYEMALKAAEFNKHCIIEKPITVTLEDADNLIQAFKEKNLKLTIVLQNRFNPPMQLLKKALQAGTFGNVLLGNATVRWTRPQSYYDNTWQGKYLSGGALINQSIHHIDALLWTFNKKVKSVFAYTATLNHKMEAEDTAVLLIKFEDNTLASVEASVLAYPHNLEGSLTLLCEKGSVKISGVALNEISFWNTHDSEEVSVTTEKTDPTEVYGSSHLHVFKDIISAIKNNHNPTITGIDGKLALEVILAAHKSAQEKREVFL